MSLLFNGTSDFILIPNSNLLDDLTKVTYSYWTYPFDVFSNRYPMGKSPSGGNGYRIIQHNFGQPGIIINHSGTDLTVRDGSQTEKRNVWTHWCITWRGGISATTGHVYKNAIETGTYANTDAAGNRNSDAANNLTIGKDNFGANRFWFGLISHFQIFNRDITPNEVKIIMQMPGSLRNGLVGYWPMLEYSNIQPDYSGNQLNGVATGTTFDRRSPPINGIFFPKGFSRHSYVVPIVQTNVTFDAASSSGYEASLSTYTWNHTVGNFNNRFLEVSVGIFLTGQVTSITFNGQSLNFVRADVTGVYRSEIWQMVAPPVGIFAIQVTLNTSLTSIGNAQSYYNVDQINPIDAQNTNAGTNTPASGSVVTVLDNCMVMANLVASSASGITSAGTQNSRTSNNGALGTDASDDKGLITPPGSTTLTWNGLGLTDAWVVSLISIKPVQPNVSITLAQRLKKLLLGVGL